MALSSNIIEKNQEATVYVGNLDTQVNEELVWELFVQAGPVVSVFIPRDKITGNHTSFGFVEFRTELDAEYAVKVMNFIKLFNKPIKVTKASTEQKTNDIGANIFVGNLDIHIDEKKLVDTFSSFGPIVSARIMRDPQSGVSKGFGFISFDSFESSDNAIKTMHGQFFSNKVINVEYAYKKETKGERHGSAAERLLAANRPRNLQVGMLYGNEQMDYRKETALVLPPSLLPTLNANNSGDISNINTNDSRGKISQSVMDKFGIPKDYGLKPPQARMNS